MIKWMRSMRGRVIRFTPTITFVSYFNCVWSPTINYNASHSKLNHQFITVKGTMNCFTHMYRGQKRCLEYKKGPIRSALIDLSPTLCQSPSLSYYLFWRAKALLIRLLYSDSFPNKSYDVHAGVESRPNQKKIMHLYQNMPSGATKASLVFNRRCSVVVIRRLVKVVV